MSISTIEHTSVEAVVKAYRREQDEPKRLAEKVAKLEKELAEVRDTFEALEEGVHPATVAMVRILQGMPDGKGIADYDRVYTLAPDNKSVRTFAVARSWDNDLDDHFHKLGVLATDNGLPVVLSPPSDVETSPDLVATNGMHADF